MSYRTRRVQFLELWTTPEISIDHISIHRHQSALRCERQAATCAANSSRWKAAA